MPAIPTLAFKRANLIAREISSHNSGRVELSPTALGLLLPLFICFIFGPIACVYFIRRHRRHWRARTPFIATTPTERKEDARKRLEGVTVVAEAAKGQYACKGGIACEKSSYAHSVLERECAICLSNLHAPSPPEPAKLSTEACVEDQATTFPSISEQSFSEPEVILRLRVCDHEFHAECLTSWFVIGKFSCPICRAIYYGKEAVVGGE